MLDLLAFKATNVTAENIVQGGNFQDNYSKHWDTIGGTARNENGVVTVTSREGATFTTVRPNIAGEANVDRDDEIYFSIIVKNHDDTRMFRVYAFENQSGKNSESFATLEYGKFQKISGTLKATNSQEKLGLGFQFRYNSTEGTKDSECKFFMGINLTKTFGRGNEPTVEQMDMLLEQFPDSWFDGTKNLFNAKEFMNMYHKKMKELDNAITALGGGS